MATLGAADVAVVIVLSSLRTDWLRDHVSSDPGHYILPGSIAPDMEWVKLLAVRLKATRLDSE